MYSVILQGFISSYARDEILEGLERIEKDIEVGKFHWRNNKDIRSNIVEALIDIVEGPAKRLDAVISRYAQILTVLQIWCHDSIDKFVAQIKELQVDDSCSWSILAKLCCIVYQITFRSKHTYVYLNISVWSTLLHPVNDSNLGYYSDKKPLTMCTLR